jgi:hypothetical protein
MIRPDSTPEKREGCSLTVLAPARGLRVIASHGQRLRDSVAPAVTLRDTSMSVWATP